MRMDAMRVFAAFSVVMLHAAASSWNKPGPDFIAAALFDTAVRYSVPVFVMLSGAFLLDPEREMPLKKLYQRHVLQTAFVLLVWSVGYAGFHQVLLPLCRGAEISWKTFLGNALLGHYHLWYLYMIVGLYLAVPVLRLIARERKALWYYLGFWALFGVLAKTAAMLLGFAPLNTLLNSKAHLYFFTDFAGYFLLGYALRTAELKPKWEKALCWMAPVGYLGTAAATFLASWRSGAHVTKYMDNFCLFVFLEAVGIFTVFQRAKAAGRLLEHPGFAKAVSFLSELTLGVYLIHPFLLNLATKYIREGSAFLLVPVHFLATLLASILFTFCVKKIPLLRKLV